MAAADGVTEVQGAANGFGLLVNATIRMNGEEDHDPDLILTYSLADQGWDIEIVPSPQKEESHAPHDNG